MSRARPSGPSASLRINSAARARPCAAGNARCRMRRPPVRRMGAVRLQSSDGGILTVLAERVLDDGGVVVGVAQTAPTRFRSRKSVSVSWPLEIHAPLPEPHLPEYILRWLPLPQAAPYRRHHPGQIHPRPADKDVLPVSVTFEAGVYPRAGNAR